MTVVSREQRPKTGESRADTPKGRKVLFGAVCVGASAVALIGTTQILKLTEGSQRTVGITAPDNFHESPKSLSGDRIFVGPAQNADQVDCGGTRFMPKGLARFVLDNGEYKPVERSQVLLPDGRAEVHCAVSLSHGVGWSAPKA